MGYGKETWTSIGKTWRNSIFRLSRLIVKRTWWKNGRNDSRRMKTCFLPSCNIITALGTTTTQSMQLFLLRSIGQPEALISVNKVSRNTWFYSASNKPVNIEESASLNFWNQEKRASVPLPVNGRFSWFFLDGGMKYRISGSHLLSLQQWTENLMTGGFRVPTLII